MRLTLDIHISKHSKTTQPEQGHTKKSPAIQLGLKDERLHV
ncbi:hypothetical protein MADE_000001021185 [Alteromonas mediterranea DE]|uniref:Uncharacterized protein n=1 Tax=Alteromonas mediterranea (strain DSM 17117 / CIP 110805 / LMG 28347 / Deep ecotype) TaxID=1774373 RepID=T2DKX0_ALTMD|nr:hypothetical protein MADE_000001021185 [Alteromonas mediterranea DE]